MLDSLTALDQFNGRLCTYVLVGLLIAYMLARSQSARRIKGRLTGPPALRLMGTR